MTKASESNDSPDQSEHPPHRVRLPGFITDEEIGLGDVIKRATSYFGIQALRWLSNAGRLRSTAGWFSPAGSRGRRYRLDSDSHAC